MWSLLRSLEGIQIINLLWSVWQCLFTRHWLFSLWEFFNQVRKSEGTDHRKSIMYLKVIAEGTHQNSSLEKKTQDTFICIDEDDQGNSNIIISGVQVKSKTLGRKRSSGLGVWDGGETLPSVGERAAHGTLPRANSLWSRYGCEGEAASGKLWDEVFFQVSAFILTSKLEQKSKNMDLGGGGKVFMVFLTITPLQGEGLHLHWCFSSQQTQTKDPLQGLSHADQEWVQAIASPKKNPSLNCGWQVFSTFSLCIAWCCGRSQTSTPKELQLVSGYGWRSWKVTQKLLAVGFVGHVYTA